jgi:hypothetical protein
MPAVATITKKVIGFVASRMLHSTIGMTVRLCVAARSKFERS